MTGDGLVVLLVLENCWNGALPWKWCPPLIAPGKPAYDVCCGVCERDAGIAPGVCRGDAATLSSLALGRFDGTSD